MNRELLERRINEMVGKYDRKRFGMGPHIERIKEAMMRNKHDRECSNKHLVIAVEELAELTKEITKSLRFPQKNNSPMRRISLEEEIADVYVGIEYIKEEFGLSDERIHNIIDVKLQNFLNQK